MEAEEEQIREFNLISAELIQRNSQEGLESELPPIPPEELEVTAEQDSPDARPQSTKTVAFTVGEAEKKKPATDRTKKTTRAPCRFSVPPSAQEDLAELLEQQTRPRVKVMRSELRHRRALQHQVRESTKRLVGAQRGKALEAMVKEHGEELVYDRRLRRKGFREFSALAPLSRVHFGTRRPTEQSGDAKAPTAAGGPATEGGKPAPALGRKAANVMVEMAKMQVNASQWFQAELLRQVESCPDLDFASSVIRKRQHLEQGRNGLQEVINTTWARVLGFKSESTTSRADHRATMIGGGAAAKRKSTYDPDAIYVGKVERHHKPLVWSQQFGFFDKRIAAEITAEDSIQVEEEDRPIPGSLASTARRHRSTRKKLDPPPAIPSMRSTFDVADWKTTYRPKPPHKLEPTSAPKLGGTASSLASTMPASWRKAVGESAVREIDLPLPSAVVPGGRSAQPSALDQWSNEYYGEDVRGKSVLEHEDVLHTVNPELFPLQEIPLRQPTPVTPALSRTLSGPL
jgi:hypothetical protein